MSDYYLEHPEALQGQPKRSIAEYVESNGILVPRRFATFKEAKAADDSGTPVFIRSEHLQDYAGVSGLFSSHTLRRTEELISASSDEDVKRILIREYKLNRTDKEGVDESRIKHYCKLFRQDPGEMEKQVSYSYWEHLDGYNRTVIADTAIPDRYHVMTERWGNPGQRDYLYNYAIFEQGKITQIYRMSLTPQLEENMPQFIELYEQIRNLPRFDQNHCPIMEIQTVGDKHYFLQYHRVRDFQPATFTLERSPEAGEETAMFVRGATSPEGFTAKISVYHNWEWSFKHPEAEKDYHVFGEEEGAFDLHYMDIFSDMMARKRKLQIIEEEKHELDWPMLKFIGKHLPRSILFKPLVSAIMGPGTMVNHEFFKKHAHHTSETGETSFVNINCISDGRKAYLKLVE